MESELSKLNQDFESIMDDKVNLLLQVDNLAKENFQLRELNVQLLPSSSKPTEPEFFDSISQHHSVNLLSILLVKLKIQHSITSRLLCQSKSTFLNSLLTKL